MYSNYIFTTPKPSLYPDFQGFAQKTSDFLNVFSPQNYGWWPKIIDPIKIGSQTVFFEPTPYPENLVKDPLRRINASESQTVVWFVVKKKCNFHMFIWEIHHLDLFNGCLFGFNYPKFWDNPLRFLELSDLGRHAAATVKAPELPSISPEDVSGPGEISGWHGDRWRESESWN